MTQSHIKFEPLILPRKTPAEEIAEAMAMLDTDEPRPAAAYGILHQVRERLLTPDEPKRWDGVWPWVAKCCGDESWPFIHFGKSLGMSPRMRVCSNYDVPHSHERPYHDGVIITITAGDGTEFPRVEKNPGDESHKYLRLSDDKVVKITGHAGGWFSSVGEVLIKLPCTKPLPPGTVTRITINHTLPTTEERYSVEVVKPKFEPITIGDTIVSAGDNWVEADYGCSISAHRFPIARAREYIAALTAAANHLDPQEQPATVAVSEGLPLEMQCAKYSADALCVSEWRGALVFAVEDEGIRGVEAHISPADEARLRNLLNQRAEGGDE